ncbi:MAG TPA: hydrogenase maturation nickel metallochaperone HypA [Dissulfurispiraceae bacterium]|nr:hydrogenase maturation nickel metallochaperone HypA [Dissulfurispiraceae bacterium]
MHEVSIAQSLLDTAVRECRERGFQRIESITVRIGRASGVLPEALLFAFDALKEQTLARGAALLIDEVPLTGACRACGGRFTVEEKYILQCPLCEGTSYDILTGRELDIVEMEVDE